MVADSAKVAEAGNGLKALYEPTSMERTMSYAAITRAPDDAFLEAHRHHCTSGVQTVTSMSQIVCHMDLKVMLPPIAVSGGLHCHAPLQVNSSRRVRGSTGSPALPSIV